jgi:Ankyrin repeat
MLTRKIAPASALWRLLPGKTIGHCQPRRCWSGLVPIRVADADYSALHMAAANEDADLAQLLVDNGADSDASITLLPYRDAHTLGPHFQGAQRQPQIREAMAHLHTPFHLALYRNRDAVSCCTKTDKGAMILLQVDAKLSGRKLVQAVDFDSEVLVQTLLDRGADVSEESWNGSTALQACLRAGHSSLAGILLRAGARLKGSELFSAFKAGQRKLIDILLANGASLQDPGPNGESTLEAAWSSQRWQQMFWAIQHVPSPYDSGALCAAVCSSVEEKDVVYLRGDSSDKGDSARWTGCSKPLQ